MLVARRPCRLQRNARIRTDLNQSLSPIRLHVPELPILQSVGLDEQRQTASIAKAIDAFARLG
ncbi:hypothetical protein X948_5198 [Burkholderia pseudomallei MSHR5608]|nr:hypothetical protein X948_5198 [Burkholderia pseudomallei MSHR5608]